MFEYWCHNFFLITTPCSFLYFWPIYVRNLIKLTRSSTLVHVTSYLFHGEWFLVEFMALASFLFIFHPAPQMNYKISIPCKWAPDVHIGGVCRVALSATLPLYHYVSRRPPRIINLMSHHLQVEKKCLTFKSI